MRTSLLLLCRLVFLFLPLLLPVGAKAQNFTAEHQAFAGPQALKKVLTSWEVYRLDAVQMKSYLHDHAYSATLNLQVGTHNWKLALQPSNILDAGYAVQVAGEQGIERLPRTDQRAFKGYELNSNGRVRLTLDGDFMQGYVDDGKEKYYIEPLWYHQPGAQRDLFLVYPMSNVIRDQEATCMEIAPAEELEHLQNILQNTVKNPNSAELMACYQLDIAIAADKSMFTKYGSVGEVEAHNIAIINDVEGNYTGNFVQDIHFNIVTQFIVTGTDPWTSSTNAGTLLDSFTAWGNNGGFGVAFDNGELWTNRDFDGSTVGIAWLGGLCNSNKYHCLQDFTANSELLRCMTAHEIGHNFTAVHDGTGACPPNYIMCPFVSTATDWSSNSTSMINAYITQKINSGCLSPCSAGPPLAADFSWSPNPPCVGQQVQFTDMSSGNITGRTWSFPGGTPPTSTATNPTVTWTTAGTRNVTLTLTGGGGPVSTVKQITVLPIATANFTQTHVNLTYTFTSTSTNATSYSWDFGDGQGYSTDQNPVYTYPAAGIYTVVLTVENSCGTSTKSLLINTVPTADFSADPQSGCAPLVVSFSNGSSSNATSYTWQFPGGQPSSSNLQNPVVTYNNSGTYTVTLTAFNVTGSATKTKTSYIVVQNIPSASFTQSINGLTVSFNNVSGGASSFLWNFGDGQTSTLTSPTHTYANGGVYTVTLTSTNACGSNTATQTVTLAAPPTASFTANTTSGCGPLTVQFNNTSGGNPTSFAWSFPGGTPDTSSAQNPSVVYNNPGTYTVTLVATNALGSNTATLSNYITVNTTPAAGFSFGVNGTTAIFNNSTTGGVTFSWNFGDNSPASQDPNPTHTYATDGVYTVVLTATNPCGTTTATHTVTIVTPPTAGFTAATTSGCGPLTVQFTSTSSPNTVSYAWSFPGGNPSSSTVQNPVVVYNTPGTYSVTLTVSNAAGSNTASQSNLVTVIPGPTAGFSASVAGALATFTNSSANGTSYNWNFGDSQTSSAQNPTHTYANDGTYEVTLATNNACGTSTATQIVVIATPPTAGFSATPTSGCGPLTVQFTNASSVNATTYAWSFPGGNPSSSTAQNPSVVYSTPGTYTVTLTVSNTAGTNTSTQTNYITVNGVPTAGFTSATNGATANFTNTSVNATTYAWTFGDGGTSGQANPSHTYANDGTYTVTLTATNACGNNTSTQTVTIVTPPTAGFTAANTSGCGPLTVQFSNASSANATTFNWSFPGGSPASSSAQNPVVTYDAPGTYTVTLVVSNSAGSNTATQNNLVTVGSGPTAGFSSSTDSLTATFSNASVNASSYSWDFGDGGGSIASNPTHTYASDGTYTVVLTATNACGTATFTQSVVILTSPNAGFTANSTTGCGPLTVQFQDLSSENTTAWAWSFPGGSPSSSTVQNPTVVYSTPGAYTVTLVASSGAGTSTFTQVNFITVLPLPTPDFTSNANGTTVNFTNASQNAGTYLWNFGDASTSSQANPTHTYAADGVYTVTLTASNNCGSLTSTQTVTIVTPPAAAFVPSSNTGCAPFAVQFENQSSVNATSFAWTFEGGTPGTSTDANPSATWNQPGTYTVTLVASNSAGTTSATSTITVQGPPSAGFTSQTAGLSVILTNTSGNATTYTWDFGDGNTGTEANPTHTYASTGTYTVTLKAENACGVTPFTQTVEIAGTAPIAAFAASETTGCLPAFTVQFNDQSAGSPSAWQWTFQGGNPSTSTNQNPTVVYNAPGSYTVTLAVTNAYGNNTTTQSNLIQVIDVPTSGFMFSANQTTVNFTSTSLYANTYFWNFGDGSTSTEANPTHVYAAGGNYTVELTVTNSCGANTLQQTITLVSGTGEVAWLEQFRLFPNPTSGIFTVQLNGDARETLDFDLYNAIGQLAQHETANFSSGQLQRNFDYSHLPAGMYTLQIRAGSSVLPVKVVIQR